jgi:membrane protease YdiL (CAAX protease family)
MSSLILEFFTVFILAILPQALISFYPDEMREALGKLPGNWRFISTLPSRIGVILLMVFIASSRWDEFYSIGLNPHQAASSMTLICAGLLTGYLLLIFLVSNWRSKKVKNQITDVQQRTLAGLRYSPAAGFWQRLFYFVDLWLAVIGEELVYRGYLVLLLSRDTGSLLPWMILSLTLSMVVHLYQGRTWRLALSQLVFASLFMFAAVITRSLVAAIIPHLIYNTVWLIRALRNMSRQEAAPLNGPSNT